MNVDTNELFLKCNKQEMGELKKKHGEDLKEVPEHLEAEANILLDGQDYVKLEDTVKGPLINWAKKQKKKNKRKIANKSKKANRS